MENRTGRRRALTAVSVLLASVLALAGCRKEEPPKVVPMAVLASEPLRTLMEEEAAQYNSLYPGAPVVVHAVETREAVVHLLNDSVHAIAVDRPLNEEERAVAEQAGMHLTENAFAGDGLAVIVHSSNPLMEITVESVRKIVTGSAENWKAVPESRWAGLIDLVLPGRNAGTSELLQSTILKPSSAIRPTTVVRDQAAALAHVATHPNALTFVSVLMLSRLPDRTRLVGVGAGNGRDSIGYVRPSQMDLYQSLYPLHYLLYLYTSESKAAVGTGFSTFVVATLTGQKVVQNAGLAPVKIPNRVIQLNPE